MYRRRAALPERLLAFRPFDDVEEEGAGCSVNVRFESDDDAALPVGVLGPLSRAITVGPR
jgi:hypothetical protein